MYPKKDTDYKFNTALWLPEVTDSLTFENDNFNRQNDEILKVRIVTGNIEFSPEKKPIKLVLDTLSGKELRQINIESTVRVKYYLLSFILHHVFYSESFYDGLFCISSLIFFLRNHRRLLIRFLNFDKFLTFKRKFFIP